MDTDKSLWNAQQNYLREIILKPNHFDEAIALFLKQHAWVHVSEMSGINVTTFEDALWKNLEDYAFRDAVGVKGRTIAYGIWHATRIEDITMNLLVDGHDQVIDRDNWIEKINAAIYDTGNALDAHEIHTFSSNINRQALFEYRMAVGRKTRSIVQSFNTGDLKRKFDAGALSKIFEIGAVSKSDAASWLVDFWGKKNVAGILLMPATRHHMVHINESLIAKRKAEKQKKSTIDRS